jgi:catechol 2,3-dioxygenase-like lactoylglutathione lyase family enzyme
MPRIVVASLFVDDQERALRFYTDTLGFLKKADMDVGDGDRWLTVVSPEDPDGVELLLEPSDHPAVGPFKAALVRDGIPATSFAVADVRAEFERLRGLAATFTQEPMDAGGVTIAVLNDTCGNLIQLVQT